MFYMPQGQLKDKGKHLMYKKENFSLFCSKLLSTKDIRFNSNDLRHMVVTGWLDYENYPTSCFHNLVLEHVNKETSKMMLNSVQVWNTTYDDSQVDRSLLSTIAQWPKFQEFMKQQHLDKASEVDVDPLTFDFSQM